VPAFLFIGAWAGMQWMLKLQQDEHPMSSPVAVWAHIGGFVFGFCVTLLLRMTARKSEPSKE
jgi:membrane associated rhomboid family serine protease